MVQDNTHHIHAWVHVHVPGCVASWISQRSCREHRLSGASVLWVSQRLGWQKHFCSYFLFLLFFTVSFLCFNLFVCLALTFCISVPYLLLLLRPPSVRPPSVPPLSLPYVPVIFTSSSMFITVLNAVASTVVLTVWDWRAKFVSNGMCQFRVLQSRNAHLRRWRTWNKGKTISPSHGR